MGNKSEKSGVREAGRGALAIAAAKAWFMICGMGLLFILPRIGAGTDEERAALFGTYSVVVAILNPMTMMMITGTLQAVSKFISENPRRYRSVIAKALSLQAILGVTVAGLFALSTSWIADLLGDASLATPLRLASIIILLYAFYAVFIGGFNGTRRFTLQAGMDIAFASLKVVLILGLVYLGFGVEGAIGGFAACALIMTLIAMTVTLGLLRIFAGSGDSIDIRRIFLFEFWIMIFALASNLLMNADLYIVKALTADAAGVGTYSAALQMARLPFVAVISLTFVLFPMVSHATYSEDLERARSYIFTACRYALLIIGAPALTLAACSEDVIRLLFPPIFIEGSPQLALLTFAYIAYSFLVIFCTIISSAGKPAISTLLMLVSLFLSCAATYGGIKYFGRTGAACGVLFAMTTGAAIAAWRVKIWLNPPMPWATLGKTVIAGLLVFGLGQIWHPEHVLLIVVKGLGTFSLFLSLMYLMKEFSEEDRSRFRKVIGRR